MRAALVALIATVLVTCGCYRRRAKFPRPIVTTSYRGAKKVRTRGPPPRVALDNRGADGIVIIEDRFTFRVPATWRAEGSDRFLDPSERHSVTIAAYDKELEPSAWAAAYYPGATVRPTSNGVLAAEGQTTVLLAANSTDLFELTCTQSDVSKDVPNAVCRDVFDSFRVR